MRRRPLFFWPLALCLLLPLPTKADAPPRPPTLAQALLAAPAPKEDVFLAVAADKVLPPQDAAPPQKDDPASTVAQDYGRLVREFGNVTAVAPPTMTVLNAEPGTPNPYDGMPPGDALKLLLAGLSDAQWKTLTGSVGLGLPDLEGDTQKVLFGALFPAAALPLYPKREFDSYGGEDDANLPQLTRDDVHQAHLRLGQRVSLGMPAESDPNSSFNALTSPPGGLVTRELYLGTDNMHRQDFLYGVRLRAIVPNVSKAAALDYDAPALRARVGLAGIKTVADLIARIGGAVRTEMYADPRYEKRAVTLVGPSSARAADLLRALALCVAGTYRRVGPAYVLTDDLVGVGTRRKIIARFAQEAELARHGTVADASDHLIAARGVDALPPLDTALTLSDSQKAKAAGDEYQIPGSAFSVRAPLDQMTPAQASFARSAAEKWNARLEGPAEARTSEEDKAKLRVTLAHPFTLSVGPTLLLQTPSVPGAILLDAYLSADGLFNPSQALRARAQEARQRKQMARQLAAQPPAPAYVMPPAPPLGPLMSRQPRRAVLARPRTLKEVDALVVAMKGAGFNALWLDVFSGGKSHIDTDPDILTEALKQTKGTGITVCPALDLLHWGSDAPEDARDRTVLGETSAQAEAHDARYQAIIQEKTAEEATEEAAKLPPPADLAVCPVAPAVQAPLLALVRRLAATEGVAGIVLRGTVMAGYDKPPDSRYGDIGGDPLGYALPLRLAFLRRMHLDPVDLTESFSDEAQGADMSLPDFDDHRAAELLWKQWSLFRAGADHDLLQRLYAAAHSLPARALPVWIAQRRPTGRGDWYGLWDGLPKQLPALSEMRANGGEPNTGLPLYAHAQCRLDLYDLPVGAGLSRDDLAYNLQDLPPGWDGFVLDLGGNASGAALDGLTEKPAAKPR